jgi:hypothetical protein
MDDHITDLRLKSEKKATAVKELDLTVYPDELNISAWNTWIDYRKQTKCKKYKTDAKMKALAKMGNQAEQMEIVMISVNNEYQGLFALKGNGNGQGFRNNEGASQKESSHERIKRENAAKYGKPDECGLGMGADDRHMGGTVGEGERGKAIEHVDRTTFIDYE